MSGTSRESTGVTAVELELQSTLDRLDEATNYADWVGDTLSPFVGGDVAEIGAGTGTLTARLRPHADSLAAIEPYAPLAEELTERFRGDPAVDVFVGDLAVVPRRREFDTAVLVNVLEHIAEDEATLVDIHARLRPGGRVVLFVPAFQLLYSLFDAQIGHHRRYRKRELIAKLEAAGFVVDEARYFNAVGFPLWLVGMRLLRLSPARSRMTAVFDRIAVPLVRRAEAAVAPPFGQSLICVGRRVLPADTVR